MGLTISSVFSRLFGKKQMRILMGKSMQDVIDSSLMTRYKDYHIIRLKADYLLPIPFQLG